MGRKKVEKKTKKADKRVFSESFLIRKAQSIAQSEKVLASRKK